MKYFSLLLISSFLFTGSILAQSVNEEEVVGVWLSQNGNEKIEVYQNNGRYWGKIVWMKEPNTESGHPKVDEMNPKEELRDQPLVGLEILMDFKEKNKGVYTDGKIYDASSGKFYNAIIKVKGNVAKIRAYIGIPLIGKTEIVTKVES